MDLRDPCEGADVFAVLFGQRVQRAELAGHRLDRCSRLPHLQNNQVQTLRDSLGSFSQPVKTLIYRHIRIIAIRGNRVSIRLATHISTGTPLPREVFSGQSLP